MNSPLEKPDGLSWDPASVELPQVPMLPPGQDAMSMTIAAVLPTLTTPLTASVAALSAKETMFSGKLGAAQAAYQNADESGGQSVGQLTSMLGQVGQMGQQAAGAGGGGGGGAGMFGQLIQQAMKAATEGGSQTGGSQGGAVAQPPAGTSPAPAAGQPPAGRHEPVNEDDAQHREAPAERPSAEGPGTGDRQHGAGPAPIAAPEQSSRGDDDLARKV